MHETKPKPNEDVSAMFKIHATIAMLFISKIAAEVLYDRKLLDTLPKTQGTKQ